MNGYDLKRYLDTKVLLENRICIAEVLPQNVDFLLKDITDLIAPTTLFTFNESARHFKHILNHNVTVNSIYDQQYDSEFILDDAYIGRNLFNVEPASNIVVFRANTCRKIDYYDYDIVIKVEPLESGCCQKFDGIISIINREKPTQSCKYKVQKDKTHYYDV